jgi:tetratricopeptide (TPR) repeat protein
VWEEPSALGYAIVEKVTELLDIESGPLTQQLAGYSRNQTAYHYFLKGVGYYKQNALQDSREALEEALIFDEDLAAARAYLGLALLQGVDDASQTGQVQQAISQCQIALGKDPDLPIAHYCLGEGYLKLKHSDASIAAFKNALAFSDGLPHYRALARFFALPEEKKGLVTFLKPVVDGQPDFFLGYSWLGYVYHLMGESEKAISNFKAAIDLAPEYFEAYNSLGAVYATRGCWEKSVTTFEKALSIEKDASVYRNLAVIYFYSGRYPEAKKYAEQSIFYRAEESASERIHIDYGNLADILYWAPGGNRRQAIESYEKALDLVDKHLIENPSDLEALAYKASYLAMIDKEKAALEALEQVLSEDPPAANFLYKSAMIQEKLGNRNEALDYFNLALEEGFPRGFANSEPLFRNKPEFEAILAKYPDQASSCP